MVQTDVGSRSAAIRARMDHPIIDADGHMLEHVPTLDSYIRREGIAAGFDGLGVCPLVDADRIAERSRLHGAFMDSWSIPARQTRDLATATLPSLLYERMDELGLDFAVVYPTFGPGFTHLPDEHLRRGSCRALNRYSAEVFADFADRLTPAAAIPMTTPEEAIDELEFAVGTLGLKAALIAAYTIRPLESGEPGVGYYAGWLDTYGIDSVHDYDPFWRRCVELGVAPGAHSLGMGWGSRRSPTNYVYNQIGHFAVAGEALAKALFLGGVTRRFPALRVGLLEGGVAWAVSLYSDLVSRWQKRNPEAIQHYNPDLIDAELFNALFDQYAGKLDASRPTWWQQHLRMLTPPDDFARCEIERAEDIRDLFVTPFSFGCEADDPMTKLAFDRQLNPFGSQLSAMFSSDIGHWDVRDMREVVEEAYELVEHGALDEQEFADFTFGNVARFYTDANPRFFEGTAVEADVTKLLST
jgi:predicted TIM-barrel fold metal-dependent hydrolase